MITHELRNYIEKMSKSNVYIAGETLILTRIADNIEKCVSNRYIELPVDADGVPWHVGDMTENKNIVNGITFDEHGAHFTNTLNDIDPSIHTHFVVRTVEDVLLDFRDDFIDLESAIAEITEISGSGKHE